MRVISAFLIVYVIPIISGELDNRTNSRYIIDVVVTSIRECLLKTETMDCFKRKIIQKFDEEMMQNRTIEIDDIMTIKRDATDYINSTNNQRSNNQDLDQLKGSELNGLLAEKINEFIKTIIVQFSFDDSGRKHKGGKGGAMMIYAVLGFASIISQLFMGKLAMISGTALLMAKIALILAAVTGLKKMTGGGGGTSDHVVYQGDHGGGWQRANLAQDMAYRGYNMRGRKSDEALPYANYGYYPEGRNDLDL